MIGISTNKMNMKKLLYTILILLISSITVFSQTSTRVELANKNSVYLIAHAIEDEFSTGGTRHLFVLTGKNRDYQYIIDIITPFNGDAKEMYKFLRQIQLFIKQYDKSNGVSKRINGCFVERVSVFGYGGVDIRTSEGYIQLTDKNIDDFLVEFIGYCIVNKLAYKPTPKKRKAQHY